MREGWTLTAGGCPLVVAPQCGGQAPPIAWITLPLPPQFGQGSWPRRPEPAQTEQMVSPAPGVPGGTSSPGFMARVVCWACADASRRSSRSMT
jgi:hypothetical protein